MNRLPELSCYRIVGRRLLLGAGCTRLRIWRTDGIDHSAIRSRGTYWHSGVGYQTKTEIGHSTFLSNIERRQLGLRT